MQIAPSAFNAGINTIQSGQRRVEQAAGDIASAPVTAERVHANEPSAARSDIADKMVEMRVGQYEAQAGARVVATADKVLGTLIDVTA
ncbi:hypothetical protein DNK06_08330 [Pseudomonas daroniae]|uniref:Pyrroloquinoline quinone biosynthesis protein PqqE n=1 Tax=Phytopseudomonas daroniae TaxID=2487519 RepID=A0A4V2KAX0_9GAMM|nr:MULTISPECIES: hypothetical protein [Pseudomonas]TBU78791.1 hypothetical protein DNK10_03380 [Pseudomonas daroniae]TBU81112.1 hypothetical protein DNK06_08330 [Pseudomonas daroniae]TBU83637.1 hypothetical protein DNK31_09095 [Pseudomonas sp. FRB 228]TBU89430.1 hypothetical protein DNJ99_17025 [Pseudomonas daroniae]